MIRSVFSVTQGFLFALGRNVIKSRSSYLSLARHYYCHHHQPLRRSLRPRWEQKIRQASSSSPPSSTEQKLIRLSKRMGELDMFSRREADRLIIDGRVLVDGKLVEVGHKVPSDLQAEQIEIVDESESSGVSPSSASNKIQTKSNKRQSSDSANRITAVVLNKPKGYVSGQAEHGQPPAIRLLTSRNRLWEEEDSNPESGDNDNTDLSHDTSHQRHYDWNGFAPAGRLDMDSTGLLVFTTNGVLAKKLIGATSTIEKEYIADVEPAVCPTRKELSMDPNFFLPSFQSERERFDLKPILGGGGMLLGDNRPLKACPDAEWIVKGEQLRLVLTEGRKHQIRRMCRELLGFHVIGLRRVRIGPIVLDDDHNESTLPEGCWRPLRKNEMKLLLPNAKV